MRDNAIRQPLDEEPPVLWIAVGLPRSGKSTWARSTGYPIVSCDAIRLALHGEPFLARAEPIVWALAKVMVAALFAAGHPTVVLDTPAVTRARRAEWRDERWQRRYALFETDAATCRERAVATGQEYLLPVIDRMAAEFEPVLPEEWD